MIANNLLPWHEPAWQQLVEAAAADRLAHGLLLRGQGGVGKGLFARTVAAGLLCDTPGLALACGNCRPCQLLASGNHPDFVEIAPEEDKKQVRVEQIRDLISRLALTSTLGGYKVAIINPADAMNPSAQNSLLKTLEEPSARTVLILSSSQPAALAATIISRCQTVRFASPPTAAALEWLQQQGDADWPGLLQLAWGAPLAALELAAHDAAGMGATLAGQLDELMAGKADAVSIAENWAADHPQVRLRWLQQQVYGLIQWQLTGQAPELVHKTLQRSLQKLIPDLSLTESYRYLDQLQRVIGLADRAINQALTILPLLAAWSDGPQLGRAAETL
ncbi:MAG: DNA polymerase III subunit delta' [Gammaproteobacteria bacterium]|nr:DNA polymerase III subunit delta' [Gammaproteobacteria bacterium]NNF61825.1 DNA polymerase III subunit delta' [Gammaproteobacteria bacterium]